MTDEMSAREPTGVQFRMYSFPTSKFLALGGSRVSILAKRSATTAPIKAVLLEVVQPHVALC